MSSSVLVIGAGGLGCPAIRRLASVGVDRLGIAEFDTVDASNLHRQLLYTEADIGRSKLEVVGERLAAMPGAGSVRVETYPVIVRGDEEFLFTFDVVIDAVDSAEQKLMLHDALVSRGRTLVHAGASGWEGQGLTVRGPGCLRCLFGLDQSSDAPDCRRTGVLGPVVGLVGLLAAEEALRILAGHPGRWERKFWTLDARNARTRSVPVVPDPACSVCNRLRF